MIKYHKMLITERRVISQYFFSQNFQTILVNSFQSQKSNLEKIVRYPFTFCTIFYLNSNKDIFGL